MGEMARSDPTRQPWELQEPGREGDEQPVPPTSPPISEEERGRAQAEGDSSGAEGRPSRMSLAATAGTAVVIIVLGVFAGAVAGWGYLIPFAVVLLIFVAVVVGQRWVGRQKTRKYGDQVVEGVSGDADDPVPHTGFDEETELGEGRQYADEDASAHDDMKGPAAGAGGPA